MKKMISLALVMSVAFISCGASAGGYGHNNNGHHGGYDQHGKDHATKRELKAEATTRYNADKALQHNINKEADTRYQADKKLQGNINAVNGDLQGAKAYQGGVNHQVQQQISTTNHNVTAVNNDLQGAKAYQGGVNHQVQGQITTINQVNANQQTTINQHTGQITTINQVNAAQQTQINTNTAVNVRQDGQINDLQNYASDMDQRLGGRLDSQQSQISKNSRDIKEAKNMAAAALAVAGQQFCTGQECGFQAAVSAATIGGSQALAVGVGGAVSENVFLNAAFTKSGSVSGGVVSGTYRFQ